MRENLKIIRNTPKKRRPQEGADCARQENLAGEGRTGLDVENRCNTIFIMIDACAD